MLAQNSALPTTGHLVKTDSLTKTFGRSTALHPTSLTIRPGVITGLVGPNGAGKSTLLNILGARIRPTSGTFTVGNGDPWTDEDVARSTCLVGDGNEAWPSTAAAKSLRLHAKHRPLWDEDLASRFLKATGVDASKSPGSMSLGQRSSLAASIALASRCELTMFDEVTVGMDAGARAHFNNLLLTDYANNPRTFVVSSHLIAELENVVEDLVVMREGRVVYSGLASHVTDLVLSIIGPPSDVDGLTRSLNVLARKEIGRAVEHIVMLPANVRQETAAQAQQLDLRVSTLELQEAIIALTSTANEVSS